MRTCYLPRRHGAPGTGDAVVESLDAEGESSAWLEVIEVKGALVPCHAATARLVQVMLSWPRVAHDLGLSFARHQGNEGNRSFTSLAIIPALGNTMVWMGFTQSPVAPSRYAVKTRPRTNTTIITTVSSLHSRATTTQRDWRMMGLLLQCPRQAKRLMKKGLVRVSQR